MDSRSVAPSFEGPGDEADAVRQQIPDARGVTQAVQSYGGRVLGARSSHLKDWLSNNGAVFAWTNTKVLLGRGAPELPIPGLGAGGGDAVRGIPNIRKINLTPAPS
jgi:hypothetical protein